MISRHSSNDMSRNEVWRRRPALLTRMSTPPNFAAASAASRGGTAGSETSPIAASALPPAASISRHDRVDRRLVGAPVHHDRRAVLRQRQRDRATDILARARHERDLALQR